MAKSARSSAVKSNNQRLKKHVFGPVEAARADRLSAKLLELAAQPKPQRDVEMASEEAAAETDAKDVAVAEKEETMEVDSGVKPAAKKAGGRGKVEKRKGKSAAKKKSSIVFPTRGKKKRV